MNAKLQRTLTKGRGFLIRHVEKTGFVCAVLCLACFAHGAMFRQGLEWTPDDLRRWTQKAEENTRRGSPVHLTITPYNEIARRSRMPIPVDLYATELPFRGSIWPIPRRETPETFAVQELLASAGHGAFAMRSEEDDYAMQSDVPVRRGQRWVVVTGVIEHPRQVEAFRKALASMPSANPGKDYPDYVYFRVERAEVNPQRESSELNWVNRPVRKMFARSYNWFQPSQEIVGEQHLAPDRSGISLVFPLGPLQDRAWGPEVTHPRILASASATGESYSLGGAQNENEYLLFRYFDYDVAPGAYYRYRAKLILANPNYRIMPYHLVDEQMTAIPFLETEWSSPSATVHVPTDSNVLAVGAKPWSHTATVLLEHFSMETGEVAFEEADVRCGQLLNFSNREFVPPEVRNGSELDVHEVSTAAASSREAQKVDYLTDMLLLDVSGGRRLPGRRRLTEPVSLLLLDKDGNLVVRNELDDFAEQRRREFLEEAPPVLTWERRHHPGNGRGPDPPDRGTQRSSPL